MLAKRVPCLYLALCVISFLTGSAMAGSPTAPSSPLPSTCDCPPGIEDVEPARFVAQVIDNTFHLWAEYDLVTAGGDPACCIVMEKPQHKLLSAGEAQNLLLTSSQWYQPGLVNGTAMVPPESDRVEPEIPGIETTAADKGRLRIATVCGSDDRIRVDYTQVFPWNTVCYLHLDFPGGAYRSTGTLIGPYTILTAGHSIYDWDQTPPAWVNSISAAPGQYQDTTTGLRRTPYGEQQAARFEAETRWVNEDLDGYDYGAVFVSIPFSGISTYMPVEFEASVQNLQVGGEIYVAGYPTQDPAGSYTNALYYAQGTIRDFSTIMVTYLTDTYGGQSGGPVYRYYNGTRRLVAVHKGGTAPGQTCYNGAPRLRAENRDLITRWMQWTPAQTQKPAVTINFDDVMAPCLFASAVHLTNRYASLGVTFQGPWPTDGGAILDACSNFGVTGYSAPNFLAFHDDLKMDDKGKPRAPETLTFSPPVSNVVISAGTGSTYAGYSVTLEAFDAQGQRLDTKSIILMTALKPVSVSGSGITRVVVSSTAHAFVLDDLTFSYGSVSQ